MKQITKQLAPIALAFALIGGFAMSATMSSSAQSVSPADAAQTHAACELQDCKPAGASCNNSFECCSQNCQTVNGSSTCH